MLDHPSAAGGTGRAVDPALARDPALVRGASSLAGWLPTRWPVPCVLPEPRGRRVLRPERAPGKKDMISRRAFVDAARGALVGMEADA